MHVIYVLQQFIAILEPLTIHIPQVDRGCRIARAGYRIIGGRAAPLKEAAATGLKSERRFHTCTRAGEDERHTPGTTGPAVYSLRGGAKERNTRRRGRCRCGGQVTESGYRGLSDWLAEKCVLRLPDNYKEFKHGGSEKMVLFAMWPDIADSGTDIWETSSGLDFRCGLL